MAEEVTARVSRYVNDGSDQDLRRLLRGAELVAEPARTAFRRAGVQHGWNVIDCGCGPIGGLAVLAEMVGPAGRVVGVDVSPAAIQRARAVVTALELGIVEVVAGDLHDLDAAALGGPFDLAFSRAFMMHQADPVRTLRRIADLLRPGGWLVVHEALESPPPRSHPHLEAVADHWDLVHEVLHRNGVPAGAVKDLPRSARQAGLEVTAMRGLFLVEDPEPMFEIYAATVEAVRERGIQLGIAAERIDGLVQDLRAAKDGGYEWVTSSFYLDLALRKPAAG
jgi:SAM-dependent methyltransferase